MALVAIKWQAPFSPVRLHKVPKDMWRRLPLVQLTLDLRKADAASEEGSKRLSSIQGIALWGLIIAGTLALDF